MKKGSKIYSILTSTCPRCQEGKMYNFNAYKLNSMTKIKPQCENCGQAFEPEPMFYQGAMYVSYGFSVAIVVSVFVAFNILFDDPIVNQMIFTGIALAIVLSPLNLRLSRNVWANIFIDFKKDNLTSK